MIPVATGRGECLAPECPPVPVVEELVDLPRYSLCRPPNVVVLFGNLTKLAVLVILVVAVVFVVAVL